MSSQGRWLIAAMIAVIGGSVVVSGLLRRDGGSAVGDRARPIAWLPDEASLRFAAFDEVRFRERVRAGVEAVAADSTAPRPEALSELVTQHAIVLVEPSLGEWLAFTRGRGGSPAAVAVPEPFDDSGRPTDAFLRRWEASASLTRDATLAIDSIVVRVKPIGEEDGNASAPAARIRAFAYGRYLTGSGDAGSVVEVIVPMRLRSPLGSETGRQVAFYGMSYRWNESHAEWRPFEGWMYSTVAVQGAITGPLF